MSDEVYTEVRTKTTAYGLIGFDVEVRTSEVDPSYGLGLFALRSFNPGDAITIYDGDLVYVHDLPRFTDKVSVSQSTYTSSYMLCACCVRVVTLHDCGMLCVFIQMKDPAYSHVIRIKHTDYCVVGNRTPSDGRGGGQFANHSKKKANSVVKVVAVKQEEWHYYGALEHRQLRRDELCHVVLLVAKRFIAVGEEIVWCYPKGTVARMGLVEECDSPREEDQVSDVDLNIAEQP